jgi:hypothetical protein
MPTPTPTAPKPAPAVHQQLAADLRTLADIAAAHPELAELLAVAVGDLHLVVRISGTVRAQDVVAAAVAAGAVEVDVDDLEPIWASAGVRLPAGAVRLTVTQLTSSVPSLDVT